MQFLIPIVVAVLLMVLGLSYLLQGRRWILLARRIMAEPEQFFAAAVVMVAAGQGIGWGYDNWSGTWPLFVTLLGWLVSIEGALILLFPGFIRAFQRLSDRFLGWYLRIGGVILLLLGALLWRYIS